MLLFTAAVAAAVVAPTAAWSVPSVHRRAGVAPRRVSGLSSVAARGASPRELYPRRRVALASAPAQDDAMQDYTKAARTGGSFSRRLVWGEEGAREETLEEGARKKRVSSRWRLLARTWRAPSLASLSVSHSLTREREKESVCVREREKERGGIHH